MRQQRTIYFNDARHYYLFAFEPPMALEDAWVPIDEVSGTGVDTFAYGVERGDGLFYPSRVGMMFGADIQPFEQAAYWRTWHNMQSLIERGLDPLTVLIDRAHDREMDFWASLRMAAYGNMEPAHKLADGGGGLAHAEVRAHILQVVEELATEYETDGVELDFALPGGGTAHFAGRGCEGDDAHFDRLRRAARRASARAAVGRDRSAGFAHRGNEPERRAWTCGLG